MWRFWKWIVFSCGLLAAALLLSLVAAENGKEAKKSADKPAAKAEDKPADLDKVPEGTNDELLDYIEKVKQKQPANFDEQRRTIEALVKASDKILDANPTPRQLMSVVQLRMSLPMTHEEIRAFAEKLSKLGAAMTKAGKTELGREALDFSYLVKIIDVRGDAEEFKKAVEPSLKHLAAGKPQKSDLMLADAIIRTAEQIEDPKVLGEASKKIIAIFKGSKFEGEDKELVERFIKQLEGTIRRMELVGNKIELEGRFLSGGKLDLAKYKGKVLLVDFWATWCVPCLAEIPNMKKNYEAYHDKGFDILGLSWDENRETLEKFVKDRAIPWGIVYGDDAPSPSFEYYGISGIPLMILVGKDGKVISTSARGEELDKLLERQFGPAEKKAVKQN
jgi:thiol-disulfide isomerase/thioredoxin